NSGHVDALMCALMMAGIFLALSQKPVRGVIAVTLGALVKPFALLALPALWRPWNWKLPLACLAVIALCYAPYLSVGTGAFGFLAGYFAEEGLQNGDRIWLLSAVRALIGPFSGDYIIYVSIAAAVLAALALRAAFRRTRSEAITLSGINTLLLASLFL